MPIEKRDVHSGAKIFVPTSSERAAQQTLREFKKEKEEISSMKAELQELLDKAKEE